MFRKLFRLIASPANWCGLALSALVLVLKAMGLVGAMGLGVAVLGYVVGLLIGGLWFGFPSTREPAWEALVFTDEGDAREAMERALQGVRQLTEYNPERRIPASLQARVLDLCSALEGLLHQWERSKGTLSLQDSFHARHIAIRYLPEALNTFLSIPAAYAATKLLANGKTAQDTFKDSIAELEAKVRELGDDLAAQDAHAFLVHSRFLSQKFGASGLESPALNLPASEPPP
ncbi:hypothetical protein RQP53_15365 [Paucibacter sp. APW11]|uniref:5-bromo-4-chloroindolyl phosphate hydrolysis protein n=1 Tax=Roseateles aquae TaxID=3077235 RepID=A0ABU3PDI0_9BURK|nr:hypothetical protein [Paucibacter sp. APW11]MDT9000653.1 hypothetical protein [Paucibacter sp. APW11]